MVSMVTFLATFYVVCMLVFIVGLQMWFYPRSFRLKRKYSLNNFLLYLWDSAWDILLCLESIIGVIVGVFVILPDYITGLVTRLHGRKGLLAFGVCASVEGLRAFMEDDGPWEHMAWCYTAFIGAELSFISLFATRLVSYDVSRVLLAHESGRFVYYVIKHKKSHAVASMVSCLFCFVVMAFKFGRLYFPDTKQEESREVAKLRARIARREDEVALLRDRIAREQEQEQEQASGG